MRRRSLRRTCHREDDAQLIGCPADAKKCTRFKATNVSIRSDSVVPSQAGTRLLPSPATPLSRARRVRARGQFSLNHISWKRAAPSGSIRDPADRTRLLPCQRIPRSYSQRHPRVVAWIGLSRHPPNVIATSRLGCNVMPRSHVGGQPGQSRIGRRNNVEWDYSQLQMLLLIKWCGPL